MIADFTIHETMVMLSEYFITVSSINTSFSLIQAALQSPAVRAVLEEIFLVRRVQCVAEVFAVCAQLACPARASTTPAPDDSALLKPVKRYLEPFFRPL